MAFLFSSIPMFYGMDWNEKCFGWGMVDAFQAGIAALATAAILVSIRARSFAWLLGGVLLSSFTLLVKPSGLMVMAIALFSWMVLMIAEWISAEDGFSPASSLRGYALRGAGIIVLSYAFIILLCVFSRYLSAENFSFAHRALAVMKKVLAADSLLPLLHRSSGEWLPLWTACIGILVFRQTFQDARNRRGWKLKSAAFVTTAFIIWLLGAWYWIVVQAGESQYRFFYPFLLMGCICMVPPALHIWQRIGRAASGVLMILCLVPAINMAALLAAGNSPPDRWQDLTGVSVSVGGGREEISQAYAFLGEVRKGDRDVRVYFFPNSFTVQSSFALIGDYEKLLNPELHSFSNVHALDWARGFAVRINELLKCDYILVNKYGETAIRKRLSLARLGTFEAESLAFESWVQTQRKASGLEVAMDGRKLLLLRIADRSALSCAISRFVSTREWRPEFRSANSWILRECGEAKASAAPSAAR